MVNRTLRKVVLAPNSPSTAPISGPVFQKWMRRAPRELNPRGRPRSHLSGGGQKLPRGAGTNTRVRSPQRS